MKGRNRRDIPAALARGRDRFRNWRRTRKRGTRIPVPLWNLAVKLARAHGLAFTASILKLDYYALKKRVEPGKDAVRSAAPAFVELSPLAASGECVIELEDGAGASMRVHLKGYDAPDLTALSRSFYNAE